jgi:hypothetical protein
LASRAGGDAGRHDSSVITVFTTLSEAEPCQNTLSKTYISSAHNQPSPRPSTDRPDHPLRDSPTDAAATAHEHRLGLPETVRTTAPHDRPTSTPLSPDALRTIMTTPAAWGCRGTGWRLGSDWSKTVLHDRATHARQTMTTTCRLGCWGLAGDGVRNVLGDVLWMGWGRCRGRVDPLRQQILARRYNTGSPMSGRTPGTLRRGRAATGSQPTGSHRMTLNQSRHSDIITQSSQPVDGTRTVLCRSFALPRRCAKGVGLTFSNTYVAVKEAQDETAHCQGCPKLFRGLDRRRMRRGGYFVLFVLRWPVTIVLA